MNHTEFLTHVINAQNVPEKKIFQENISELLQIAKLQGLSAKELEDVTDALISLNISRKMYQTLIYCLIPNNTIPRNIIKKICTRIFIEEDNIKVKSLLQWIANILDYNLIEENTVDEFYCLFWCLLKSYPKVTSHLIYTLTKPQDVTLWRVNYIQEIIMLLGPEPYLCVLLKRFKELNSEFEYLVVPTFKNTTKKIFEEESLFYRFLRENFKNLHLPNSTAASAIIPFNQGKKSMNKNYNYLLPRVQYLQLDYKFGQILIQDIKNGAHFANNFKNIMMPSHTLSLLNSTMGIRILMFIGRNVQAQFMRNLHAILEQNLIFQQDVSKEEIEILLNNIIRLHSICQQGFIKLSNLLKLYLQFWDGIQYKVQIYKLLEWFVFKSNIEMNRFLLKPLYTLFVSSSTDEMNDILICLINLLTNLYFTIGKDDGKFIYLFEENTLRSREELIPVIQSLTKFISKLLKIGLYIYPCNNQILLIGITFYEKVNYLERMYDMPFWTIISSNVLYHCLFSFNAQLLEQICDLYKRYNIMEKFQTATLTPKIEEKITLLQNYGQDLYNFLWSSRAFADRTMGHIFRGLSLENEASWKNFVNLNNSLNLQRHIMFAPYRMMNSSEDNTSLHLSFNENLLNILKLQMPNLIDLIKILSQRPTETEDGFD